MRTFLIRSLFIASLFTTPVASAQVIIGDTNTQSTITGTVSDIGFETITLQIGPGQYTTVLTEDLDLDEIDIADYFQIGSRVQVIGEFEDDRLEANQIIRLEEQRPTQNIRIVN